MSTRSAGRAALGAVLAVMLAALPALGQDAAIQGPPAPPASPAPTIFQPTTGTPSDTQAATQPGADGVVLPSGRIILNFRDATLESVAGFLAQADGLTLVSVTKIEGRVTLAASKPVTLHQAMDLFYSLLKDHGVTAIRQGNLLKVISLDDVKKATLPVVKVEENTELQDNDEFITAVIPLRNADATQLKRDLAPLVPAYADLSSNASTNALIITDTAADVRRFVDIVHSLDTSVMAVTQVKVFALKYANATNAARLVTDVFKTNQTAGQTPGGRGGFIARFMRGGAGGGEPSPDQTRAQPQVTASADDRTNTVVVSAPNELMPLITEVLKELDANPAASQTVFIYRLRNADATNVQNVINSLFGAGGTGSAPRPTTGATGIGGTVGGSTSFGAGGSSGGNRGGSSSSTPSFGTTSSTTSTPTRAATPTAGRPGGTSTSVGDLFGQVFCVADTDTNSVLVMTGQANMEKVKEVILQMDRPVPQVLIKALLAEVTHDNTTDLGVEFSQLNLAGSGTSNTQSSFGVQNTLNNMIGIPAQPAIPGNAITGQVATPFTPAVNGIPAGGLVWQLANSSYQVAIQMLQTKGKVDILSRPYILTSDNQQASIIVGQTVPYVTYSTQDTLTGGVVNSISYQNIGIILTVTPHINPDGIVRMDVAPQTSSIDQSTTVTIAAGVNATVFDLRSAQTSVAIRDGQTIVIGGLMQDQKMQTTTQVPFLGDIPYLGNLFKRNQTTLTKTELLIFLTPHVAPVPEDLMAMSKAEEKGMLIVPNAVEPGTFKEHMQGMERGAGAATQPQTQPDTQPATQPMTQPARTLRSPPP